jgi:hypothetical protein
LCLSSFCSFFNVCVCVCLPVSNINMAILTCLCSHVVCGHCRFRFDVFIPRISHSRLSQLVWFANLTCSDTKHKKSHHTCPRCWARTDSDFLCLLFLTYSITLLLTINGAFGDKKNNKKGPWSRFWNAIHCCAFKVAPTLWGEVPLSPSRPG